jgi:hypothetical protein
MEQYHEQERARSITGRPRREAQIDALIGAMVQGMGVADAAEAANFARSTAYELLQSPRCRTACGRCAPRRWRPRRGNAAGIAAEAVGVLASLMRASGSDAVRRLAADSPLTHASAARGRSEDGRADRGDERDAGRAEGVRRMARRRIVTMVTGLARLEERIAEARRARASDGGWW